jgi:hypothetical protein
MKKKPKYLRDDILVAVTNYDFSDNADRLKKTFSKNFQTILIDSNSPVPAKTADLIIENTYYPGLWNAAVRIAIENKFKWLMFVASDLQITNVDLLCRLASDAVGNARIGIWTPSLRKDSRTSFIALFNKGTNAIRECGIAEGFFFLSRVDLLATLYPISAKNTSGWGVDVASSYRAFRKHLMTVVDDRIEIYHPAALEKHAIDVAKAEKDWQEYIAPEIQLWRAYMFKIFQ